MKNRIWKNWKTAGAALVMAGVLILESRNPVMGAEAGNFVQETEQETVSAAEEYESETENEEISETDDLEADVIVETEEIPELQEDSEPDGSTEDIQRSEFSECSMAAETALFTDNEENEKKPGYKIWITPEQEQIKAGKELLYTVVAENTGNCTLRNIRLSASFPENSLKGVWEESEGAEIQGETLNLEILEAGIKKEFYLSVQIPEEIEGKISLHLLGNLEYENTETGEKQILTAEEIRETEVLPLTAEFQVTKTADRTMAVPGDKIIFQICIRNTGERTLHSVVTTERFQLENVPVRFMEAEGIILNKDRTKARIEKIEPGSSVGLLAEVTLPDKMENQKLINEVTVTTAETGEKKVISSAEIEVYTTEETPTAVPENIQDEGAEKPGTETQSKAVSTHPKTGDPMKPVRWLMMISGSLLAAGWVRSKM